ncbi:hypothetical protein H9I45_10350 [Polaribacter haliotis]|uniref:PH domain-containing protein n=1 Tax=Polaribacter haliotis TaxID=1888915 RepID=A0A7L8ACP3_9FLAO|nr:hypothetical protein [Polaribacter haliotis]QOD59751.1 hypothetical protein H9I45_10350 [Polaribacter haliotis]
MKINYHKKFTRTNLIIGLFWTLFAFVSVFFLNENPKWHNYTWLAFGAVYLGMYFYYTKNSYLVLKDGFLKQNWPFGKKILIIEITKIKYFAGDYIIETRNKKITINGNLADKNSLDKLNEELKKSNLKLY